MRVLLSGSHGLIGRALVDRLSGEGHQVAVLTRGRSGPAPSPSEKARPGGGAAPALLEVPWDPLHGTFDRAALHANGPYDAVVNLAGAGIGDRRWTPARRAEILDSRVLSTRLLVRALEALDPRPEVLVSGSAVGYYGDRGDEELSEDSAPGTGFLADVCREWEAEAVAAETVLRVVRLRSGIVLSTHGGALARQLPVFRLGAGGPMGGGGQFTSWITLRDEVSVIRRALHDHRLHGPVNATSPSPVTNMAMAQAIGAALHRPALLPVPRPLLAVMFGLGMVDGMLLASQRALPTRLEEVGHRFEDPDLDGALAALLASD